jgi:hypothetical protein
MGNAVVLALAPICAWHAPGLAEIVERADGAARAHVVEVTHRAGPPVAAILMRLHTTERLWGDAPDTFTIWAPRSACGTAYKARDLVVGYRVPSAAEHTHLALPEGVYCACGSVVARDGLCEAIQRLRGAADRGALVRLLEDERPAVRRQAFRQLTERFLDGRDAPPLDTVLSLAAGESDPELLRSYVATFGHFGYAAAGPFVSELVLRGRSDIVAGAAERAFHRVARPGEVARLVASYPRARLPVKGRILRALAAVRQVETHSLFAAALSREETVIPALDALVAAGRTVPVDVPRVRDPLRARRIRSLLARTREQGRVAIPRGQR